MGEGGFEPPKALLTDLQSAPFGHSGIPPYSIRLMKKVGAGRRTRTPDLLITNQLLYQLSYTSGSTSMMIIPTLSPFVKHYFKKFMFRGSGGHAVLTGAVSGGKAWNPFPGCLPARFSSIFPIPETGKASRGICENVGWKIGKTSIVRELFRLKTVETV